MLEKLAYNFVMILSFILAAAVFTTLLFVSAPYGRHTRRGWGSTLPNWLGWLLMEAPSPLGMFLLFLVGNSPKTLPMVLFLLMWEAHYIHRAFIYPFELRSKNRRMPGVVVAMGVVFNLGNALANGWYLFQAATGKYAVSWLWDVRFITGVGLFVAGFIINRWADRALRNLRAPGESGYKIPQGGLYRYISCPNYLGEIIQWIGWALATWSWAGLAFAVWTFANLAPRARANHRWYRKTFSDYPQDRKALIPGLW